jgi:hypothetical protein
MMSDMSPWAVRLYSLVELLPKRCMYSSKVNATHTFAFGYYGTSAEMGAQYSPMRRLDGIHSIYIRSTDIWRVLWRGTGNGSKIYRTDCSAPEAMRWYILRFWRSQSLRTRLENRANVAIQLFIPCLLHVLSLRLRSPSVSQLCLLVSHIPHLPIEHASILLPL